MKCSDGPPVTTPGAAEHEGDIDALVSDVILPGMTGPRLHQELVRARPGVKVIYISGYPGDVLERHDVLREGAVFLPKPVDLASLSTHLNQLLNPKIKS